MLFWFISNLLVSNNQNKPYSNNLQIIIVMESFMLFVIM